MYKLCKKYGGLVHFVSFGGVNWFNEIGKFKFIETNENNEHNEVKENNGNNGKQC